MSCIKDRVALRTLVHQSLVVLTALSSVTVFVVYVVSVRRARALHGRAVLGLLGFDWIKG